MKQTVLISLPIDQFKEMLTETVQNVMNNQEPANQPQDDKLIDSKAAAKILEISLPTLHTWKMDGVLPYYRIGRKVRFKKSEVLEALTKIDNRKNAR